MFKVLVLVICVNMAAPVFSAENGLIIVGGTGENCIEDPGCINRLHPDIPMIYRANPGQSILFRTRDTIDVLGTVETQTSEPKTLEINFGACLLYTSDAADE